MTALGTTTALLLLAALLVGGGRAPRVLAILVAASTLFVPFLTPESTPLARFVAAILAMAGGVRVAQMSKERPPRRFAARALQAIAVMDWRDARRVPRSYPVARLGGGLLLLSITAAAFVLLRQTWPRTGLSSRLSSYALGATAVWSVAEGLNLAGTTLLAAAGWSIRPLHDRPILSRSLAELWGERWNLTVARWLRSAVFLPLARRRHPVLGLLASFVVSALFHGYTAAAAGGLTLAIPMAIFFLVQGLLVAMERVLDVKRWPSPLARAWFLAAILVPSPLFTGPMIDIALGAPR